LDVWYRTTKTASDRGAGVSAWAVLPVAVGARACCWGMMTRFTDADIHHTWPWLRAGPEEVKEFIEQILGKGYGSLRWWWHSPADGRPLMRLRRRDVLHPHPSNFRDQGKNVLLLMDSLTPFFRPGAAGKSPWPLQPRRTKGYPPSAVCQTAAIGRSAPAMPEQGGGSIHGVLHGPIRKGMISQESDWQSASRAILDGHVVVVTPAGRGGSLFRHRYLRLQSPGDAASMSTTKPAKGPAVQCRLYDR